MKKVALDPGHLGGVYSVLEDRHFQQEGFEAIKEGDLNLRVARELKNSLEVGDYSVLITRGENETGDTNLSAAEFESFRKDNYAKRIELINDFDPDLAISIHFNSNCFSNQMRFTKFNGVMTFIYDKANTEIAKILARNLSQSFKLGFCENAWFPEEVNRLWTDIGDGVNVRELYILKNVTAPVVLTEGPLMNHEETYHDLLNDDRLIRVYADSLYKGVTEIFASKLVGS